MKDSQEKEWVIASDVGQRDGIGIELHVDGEFILEIFRDDSAKTRRVTLQKQFISLALMEEAIVKFKQEIPWEFLE